MRAAVTGGAGFLGAALINRLLDQGWSVAALARDPKKFAPGAGLELVEGDLANVAALREIAERADVFFHLAGVTHARRARDYFTANVEGAAAAARAAAESGARFIHASSLSARAPQTSPYARSKRESETAVADASGANPWTALRLPAIYGPRDRATLPYFRLVKSGLAPEPWTDPPARASMLFVEDAASAMLAAKDAPPRVVYEVGDDQLRGRTWSEIGAALGETLNTRVRRIRAPRTPVAFYCNMLRVVESALGRPPSLRHGQVDEFFHPDWVARENLFSAASPWRPQTPLKEGFAKTVLWYQENGLL